jgi:cytochrome c oxidase cbb3-type subunit 4
MISGILIALMLVLFVGLFVWAYTPGRKQRFNEAAALALVDDVRARGDIVQQPSPQPRSAGGRENRS